MTFSASEFLQIHQRPRLDNATLVLAFSGWMDGGDVSTGTVQRLVDILDARPLAEIDPEPFYIYNFPGSMELTALFRPHLKIEDGRVVSIEMPRNTFYGHEPAQLVLFVGKEPNLRWRTFGEAILEAARQMNVRRVLFVGSFGGSVPHTREPRLYVSCSEAALLPEMERYGLRRTGYDGPGSFTSYLMSRAASANLEMTSLVAEIPGYLQGRNPMSIEAVTRRLAKILRLPLDLGALRAESTEWELQVSKVVDRDEDLASTVRQLEEAYDNELLKLAGGET
ncbi:MAG: PAC2 family protein [Planctomycetes bacterium]|nr:PAC2 family protein [Planctomycetota bacterium]